MDKKNNSAWTGSEKLVVKSKVWIEDAAGDLVFGSGRLRLLMAVAEHGSLLAAAKDLGMGYRAAWGKIKATEERLGKSLLERRIGGSSGGGSDLTPFGKSLVKRFRHLQSLAEKTADTFFEELFSEQTEDEIL
jgi:molybdate transport system regulatory protein